jgi:hypothetical protein
MAKREKTGGRQKGSPNKASAEIKAVAKEYGPARPSRSWLNWLGS